MVHRVAEDGNLDLVSQIIQQNTLELTTIYKEMVDNHLCIQINSQLHANVSNIMIDLRFLEAPQPSNDNYVNVQQNSREWIEIT